MTQRVIRPRRPREFPPGSLLGELAPGLRSGPVPDGLLGWNVYAGSAEPSFAGFIPAPGFDSKIEALADEVTAELESAGEP